MTFIRKVKNEYKLNIRKIKSVSESKTRSEALIKEFKKYFAEIDTMLHIQKEVRYLADERAAKIVSDAINHRNEQVYTLYSYCIMPNHVHMLIHLDKLNIPLDNIMHSLKLYTAVECNKILNRTGKKFWHGESFDHIVRSQTELNNIINYILMNPVQAKLVENYKDWKWLYVR